MFALPPRPRAPWADLDPRITRIALARAINTFGLSLVMTFLGVYIVKERGYSAALYGVLALIANLGQSATSAWAGELSDRIGRRPLITGALSIRAGVIVALGTLVLVHAPLWAIAIVFVVSSALRGCFEPVAYALVADIVTPEQRVPAYGLQRMGVNLGWAAGPALGGLLVMVIPYGAVFYLSALGMVAANLVMVGVDDPCAPAAGARPAPPPPSRLRDSLRAASEHPPMLALLVGTVLFALVHTQMFTGLGIHVTRNLGLSERSLGLVYTLNGVLVLLLQWPALSLIERYGVGRVLVAASLGFALGFGLVGVASDLGGILLAMAAITLAEVAFAPAHQAATAAASDSRRLGATFGLVGFAQTFGVAFAPLLGGLLLDHPTHAHPWVTVWGTIAGLALVMAAVFTVQARLSTRAGLARATVAARCRPS